MASPAMTSSGRNASPRPNASPTVLTPTTNPLVMASKGSMPAPMDSFASETAASESPSMMLVAIFLNSSSLIQTPLVLDFSTRFGVLTTAGLDLRWHGSIPGVFQDRSPIPSRGLADAQV